MKPEVTPTLDKPSTLIDCTRPLQITLHTRREEEELPDAGTLEYRVGVPLGRTPTLDGAGVRVPARPYAYAEPPRGVPFSDADLKALAGPLRRAGITGLSLSGLDINISDRGLLSLGAQPHLRFLDLGSPRITDQGLRVLAEYPNLEWLRLADAKITDTGLGILRALPRLHHLDLSQTPITLAGLARLHLPHLRSLVLDGTKLTDEAGDWLASQPGLRHLSLRRCGLGQRGLEALARLPDLASLRYSPEGRHDEVGAKEVGDGLLRALARIPGLQRLNLYRFGACSDLSPLCDLPHLVHLDLEQAYSAGTHLQPLVRAPLLASLGLCHVRLEEKQGRILGQMTGLRRLDMRFTHTGDEAFRHLGGLARLEALDLTHTRITDASIGTVAGLVGLTQARINLEGVTGRCLQFLARLPHLRELDISEVRLAPKQLAPLRQMPGLRRLWLGSLEDSVGERRDKMRPLSDEGFAHLSGLGQLRELWIMGLGMEDASLRHLRDMQELRELGLSLSELRGPGLVHLAGLRQLRELVLDQTHITDPHLRHLVGLPALRELRLTTTPITDVGLAESIARMTDLTLLDLGATGITGAGLLHLRGLHKLEHISLFNTQVHWHEARELRGRPGHLSIYLEHQKKHPPPVIEVEERLDRKASGPLN